MTERRFNLIKTDFEQQEKRILPRFPFCYLTFKSESDTRVYEVKDVSYTGMQLVIKDSEGQFQSGETIRGSMHWLGQEMKLQGKVMWLTEGRAGIEFIKRVETAENIKKFLGEDRLVAALKPLHRVDYGAELPAKLKYWLRSDGPVEVFVWQHQDHEYSHFQVLLLENFVEWQDGHGLKTGRIMSKRNIDTPLMDEDELLFRVDQGLDDDKLHRVRSLVGRIPPELLTPEVKDFLLMKLS